MSFLGYSPWIGCKKFSRGCKNCYVHSALKKVKGLTKDRWLLQTDDGRGLLRNTYTSNADVFLCPFSDFLLPEADKWRDSIWHHIKLRPDIKFLIQTKRVERFRDILPEDWGNGYPNVYLNATIDDPHTAELRLAALVDAPIHHKVIALTPMTAPMNVESALKTGVIQQSYCIGEILCSPGGRLVDRLKDLTGLHYEWVRDVSEQFKKYKTHFDFKCTGTVWYDKNEKEHVFYSTVQQFQTAQDTNLGVTGTAPDYIIVYGVNHLSPITDWSKTQARCMDFDLSKKGQILY